MTGSWKTTLAAVLAVVAAGITLVAVPYLDADTTTIPQFKEFFAIALAALPGLFARDKDVSSEAQGIK